MFLFGTIRNISNWHEERLKFLFVSKRSVSTELPPWVPFWNWYIKRIPIFILFLRSRWFLMNYFLNRSHLPFLYRSLLCVFLDQEVMETPFRLKARAFKEQDKNWCFPQILKEITWKLFVDRINIKSSEKLPKNRVLNYTHEKQTKYVSWTFGHEESFY